jgi:hypothetical protein
MTAGLFPELGPRGNLDRWWHDDHAATRALIPTPIVLGSIHLGPQPSPCRASSVTWSSYRLLAAMTSKPEGPWPWFQVGDNMHEFHDLSAHWNIGPMVSIFTVQNGLIVGQGANVPCSLQSPSSETPGGPCISINQAPCPIVTVWPRCRATEGY